MHSLNDAPFHEADPLLTQVYQNTFQAAVTFLAKKYPLGPHPDFPVEEVLVPRHVKYKHVPSKETIDQFFRQSFPADTMDAAEKKRMRRVLDDQITDRTKAAVSDALTEMSSLERFASPQEAEFIVTRRAVRLARLEPTFQ